MVTALTPGVPVHRLLCVSCQPEVRVMETLTHLRAQSPSSLPTLWLDHPFPLPTPQFPTKSLLLTEVSRGLDGNSSCSLSPPPNPPFLLPCRGLEDRVSQVSGPAVSNIESQHPPGRLGKSSGSRTSYIICKMNVRGPEFQNN